jgi:quinol monooxygenase YgiN
MIQVLAFVTAKPGLRAQVLAAFNANCAAVRAEHGCIEYGAAIDAHGLPPSRGSVGDDTFAVIEKWATLADVQAHAKSVHMKAYGARTKDWVARKLIHVLEPA